MNERARDIIDEQIDYYRRRAPEYDRTSRPEGDPFITEGDRLIGALAEFRPTGHVLELACGTGNWTQLLARYSSRITAVDASAEMIELARGKVPGVRFVHEDVFSWEPDAVYDVVFFANWLSHVPESRFDEFWEIVRSCLGPSGRVFFLDEGQDEWRAEEWIDDGVVRRTLQDGSNHRVVKIFWDPDELQSRLQALGWRMSVQSTGAFIWGAGTPW